jgi:Uma2 family endonuclease
MAGASTAHNTIAMNLTGILYGQLRGRKCQAVGSDMKVRLAISATPYFYYPDAMIVCGQQGMGPSWCDQPSVIFEIISEGSRLIDEREKRIAYSTIPSLAAYVLIEQDRREVVVDHRWPGGLRREVLDAGGIVKLPTAEVEFAVADLYERLSLS